MVVIQLLPLLGSLAHFALTPCWVNASDRAHRSCLHIAVLPYSVFIIESFILFQMCFLFLGCTPGAQEWGRWTERPVDHCLGTREGQLFLRSTNVYIFFYSINEWMMHLYSVILCIAVYPKHFTIMWGGLSSTTTSVQHPLGWCDGCHRTTAPVCSPHTSYRWRGERVIEPIKWMGIIRRPWLTRASGGN